MPNYSILVHVDDRSPPQTTYVPQSNIEIISDAKVIKFLSSASVSANSFHVMNAFII